MTARDAGMLVLTVSFKVVTKVDTFGVWPVRLGVNLCFASRK